MTPDTRATRDNTIEISYAGGGLGLSSNPCLSSLSASKLPAGLMWKGLMLKWWDISSTTQVP